MRLRVTLDDITPAIWRQIDVAADLPLILLHETIQGLFLSWIIISSPLRSIHADDEPMFEDVRGTRLSDVLQARLKRFTYMHDSGDEWRFTVAIESVTEAKPSTAYPRFISGADCAPPEGCGGPWGFENFRAAMANPMHPEHEKLSSWYGRDFDPRDISEAEIVHRMKRLSRRKSRKA